MYKILVEFYITISCMFVLQGKYTHIIILFICCMVDTIPHMYIKIARNFDMNIFLYK